MLCWVHEGNFLQELLNWVHFLAFRGEQRKLGKVLGRKFKGLGRPWRNLWKTGSKRFVIFKSTKPYLSLYPRAQLTSNSTGLVEQMLMWRARGAGMAHPTSFKLILSTGVTDSRTIKIICIIVFPYGRYSTINGMTIHAPRIWKPSVNIEDEVWYHVKCR